MDNHIESYEEPHDQSLVQKVQGLVGKASQDLLTKALSLYFCFQDSDTPGWAKSIILSALGYFIAPIDGIPDFTPIAGYSDDIGILIAAATVVAVHIKEKHREEANQILLKLFSKSS